MTNRIAADELELFRQKVKDLELVKKQLAEYRTKLEEMIYERTAVLEEELTKLQNEKSVLKEAQEELWQLNIELNQIFNISIPICVIDDDFNIIHANETFCSYFRLSNEEVYNKKCYEIRQGQFCNTKNCTIKYLAQQGGRYEYEGEFTTPDNQKVYFLVSAHPFKNMHGDFLGVVENFVDITERRKTEKALQESEKKYRLLVENAQEGIWALNKDGVTTFVNPCMARMLGYSKEEMIGSHLFDFMDEENKKLGIKYLERRRKGIRESHDFTFQRKDGHPVYAIVQASTILDDDGQVISVFANIADITERKIAEQKFRLTFENASDAFFWANPKTGVIINCNKAAELLLGKRKDEIIGRHHTELHPPTNTDRYSKMFSSHISTRSAIETAEIIMKSGRVVPVQITAALIKIGDVEILQGIFRDLTDLETTKQALAQSEEKFRSLFNNASDAIFIYNLDGTLLEFNREGHNQLGYSRSELLVINFKELIAPEDAPLFEEIKALLNNQSQAIYLIQLTRKDKTPLPMELNSQIIDYNNQRAILSIARDVSERIKFDNLREQFISTVSHELRTPISVITQSIANFRKYSEILTKEQRDNLLDALSRNAVSIAELIEDLLLITRFDEQKVGISLQIYSPLELITDILEQLDSRRQAKEIKIDVQIPENLIAFGDKKQITQLFRIFIDNALKFLDKNGHLLIKAINHYVDKENPTNRDGYLIKFIDNGPGIKESDLSMIFERFFRSEDMKNIPGSGLGLYIARQIALLHQGDVYAESKQSEGSSFSVFFPSLSAE